MNIWANAYYNPGTFSFGFDVFCENSNFSEGFTGFNATVSHYNAKRSTVIVVMNDNYDYKVTVNGEEAEFVIRERGTLEIAIPEDVKTAEISVQLV